MYDPIDNNHWTMAELLMVHDGSLKLICGPSFEEG